MEDRSRLLQITLQSIFVHLVLD